MTSSSEWTQERLGSRNSLSPAGIAQCAIKNDACGRDRSRNVLPKQWREREMECGLCWETNHWGKNASWRRRGSDQAGAGRYRSSWKHGINDQWARKNVLSDDRYYPRQPEWYCKFLQWGGFGRWGWWRGRAGPAEQRCKPSWVMGTFAKMVQQCMERFRQRQMKFDQLIQPGWVDAADYFHQRDNNYSTSELWVLGVIQPQTGDDTAAHAPTTIGELIEWLDIVPEVAQMAQRTSRPGSGGMRLASGKPQWDMSIPGFVPTTGPDSPPLLIAEPVEPVPFYPCI